MELRAAWTYNKDPEKLVFRLFWVGLILLAILGGYSFGWKMFAFVAFAGGVLSLLWKFANWVSSL